MTGREKLATMTDEQVAKSMVSTCHCCIYRDNPDGCVACAHCWEGIAIWLGSEVSP